MLTPPGDVEGEHRARVDPATDRDATVTGIEAENDPAGEGRGQDPEELRLLDGDTPHDQPGDAGIGVGAGGVFTIRAMRSACTGLPDFAPSRSTTWIRRAP
jgi:hypothetical protein